MMITYQKVKTPDPTDLAHLMYQAIYQTPGQTILPVDIIYQPEIYHYIENFGQQADDYMIGAFNQKQLIGAAWSRKFSLSHPGYGTIDNATPELTLVVDKDWQHQGIGQSLLTQLLKELKNAGYKRLSLSVTKENHARQLYEKNGFITIENDPFREDILMVKKL